MDYTKIVAEILSRGGTIQTVYCDHCGQSNYVFREDCRCCGASLSEEKERDGIQEWDLPSTPYHTPPSPYANWKL